MDWQDLVRVSLGRPGMWVVRPYIDGLLTLWMGFGLGAKDGNFERFCMWLQCERYPAPGGFKNPLSPDAIIRRAVTGETSGPLTEEDDLHAVALLSTLIDEFHGSREED